jgi:cold shock CspA family protein
MKGKVSWLNQEKGHGLIQPEDGSPSVFFNAASTGKERFKALAVGVAVEFDIVPSQGFKKAENVRLRTTKG